MSDNIKSCTTRLSGALHTQANMIGHMYLNENEVDVTAGFAGAEGNLIWFNTGGCALMLRLSTGGESHSIILEQGFGFCLGKREKLTRVLISPVNRAVDIFDEEWVKESRPRAMFLGYDKGDQMSWLGELNAKKQDPEFRIRRGHLKTGWPKESDRKGRLGIVSKNHKRNWIRIAPMKGSNIAPNVLADKVDQVEKWVRDSLRCTKSDSMPKSFRVIHSKEHPRGGEPFDILWVKFEFMEETWDDEIMWDIRYLLMGSKLNKLQGFSAVLEDLREKYVTRDGISEMTRKARMD